MPVSMGYQQAHVVVYLWLSGLLLSNLNTQQHAQCCSAGPSAAPPLLLCCNAPLLCAVQAHGRFRMVPSCFLQLQSFRLAQCDALSMSEVLYVDQAR